MWCKNKFCVSFVFPYNLVVCRCDRESRRETLKGICTVHQSSPEFSPCMPKITTSSTQSQGALSVLEPWSTQHSASETDLWDTWVNSFPNFIYRIFGFWYPSTCSNISSLVNKQSQKLSPQSTKIWYSISPFPGDRLRGFATTDLHANRDTIPFDEALAWSSNGRQI